MARANLRYKFLISAAALIAAGGATGCTSAVDDNTPAPIASQVSEPEWAGAWAASPTPPRPGSQSFEDETIRQVIRLGASGDKVRVRFTNVYGTEALKIGAATIVPSNSTGTAEGDFLPLTVNGSPEIEVAPGEYLFSDPVSLDAAARQYLAISLYLPEATGPCTCHPVAISTTHVSPKGNHTQTDFTSTRSFTNRAYVSGVEVQSVEAPDIIAAFGDSITDGFGAEVDGDKRWPDIFLNRLADRPDIGIVNAGISGNRVLSSELEIFGEAALVRFDRDVLSIPNVKWIVMLEGINDIGMGRGNGPSFEEMKAGYLDIIARAHAEDIKVIGGTLLPFEGASYFTEAGEAVRVQVNDWIRSGEGFDAFIDFDAVMRDPENPRRMIPNLQVGDWLHPNDDGYKKMGEAVDLAHFQ